ncbi:MAG: phosphoglucosamine mutase [Candidatus Kapaibacterium sp.]
MPLISSVSGLRATLGDSLTPGIIAAHTSAFLSMMPYGPVVIGRDGRPSGSWIENIVAGSASALGRPVVLLGMVPTPTVQLETEHSDAACGIAITASHNPKEWNGLKFLNSHGVFLDGEENLKMRSILEKAEFKYSGYERNYSISLNDEALLNHTSRIMRSRYFSNGLDELIRSMKYTVVVDAVNASGSKAVPMLLEELGCEVIPLYCAGNGDFPHMPEPLPENLTELAAKVKKTGADLGIAVDPDADRLVLIDEKGDPISEEKTITLAASMVFDELGAAAVDKCAVVNQSTTMMVELIAKRHGARVFRSPVGEINVVNLMKSKGAVIGGEGSGGVILPDVHYGRDSLAGIALILGLMANSGGTISEITASLPKTFMTKTKQTFTGDPAGLFDVLEKKFAGNEITRSDGIRIDFIDKWLHIRTSNTEPIIRIIAESMKEGEEKELIDMAAEEV